MEECKQPEGADRTIKLFLQVQYLQLIYCIASCRTNDAMHCKHFLLSTPEQDELICINDGLNNKHKLPGLQKTNPAWTLQEDRGILTKMVGLMIKTDPQSELQYWLARALKASINGIPYAVFLRRKALLDRVMTAIMSNKYPEIPKHVLGSYFDLLVRVIKDNPEALGEVNSTLSSDDDLEKFRERIKENLLITGDLIPYLVETSLDSQHQSEDLKILSDLELLSTDYLVQLVYVTTFKQEDIFPPL